MDSKTKSRLSRRTLLRAAGATMALPLLESMVPAATPLIQRAAKRRHIPLHEVLKPGSQPLILPQGSLAWTQTDVNTIWIGKENNGADAYHSGHLNDVLYLSATGSMLAGAETGGVWLVPPNGSALPVGNTWKRPDIVAMAFGFLNEKYVFAGGTGLYVTDYNSLFPYLSWTDISPQGNELRDYDYIYKIATVTYDTSVGFKQYVVIATTNGVWFSERPSNPIGPYSWQQAGGLPDGVFSGLAAGPLGTGIVVAGMNKAGWGIPPSTESIYQGQFDSSGALTFTPATLAPSSDTFQHPEKSGWVSMDSCAAKPDRMYASVYDTDGKLYDLLRSNDSGANWFPLTKTFDAADPNNTVVNWTDFMGDSSSGGWVKHISVSSTDADTVSVPGLRCIRTKDGGTTWQSVGGWWPSAGTWAPFTKSYHSDWHVARFHPANPDLIFAGTDGGLLNTTGFPVTAVYSNFNSRLFTLQFLSNPLRGFAGESDASSGVSEGLVAGGLQDNGNVYVRMNPFAGSAWQEFEGGDGGWNTMFSLNASEGWLVHYDIPGGRATTLATQISNLPPYVTSLTIVPPAEDPNHNPLPAFHDGWISAVVRPSYIRFQMTMYAVGCALWKDDNTGYPNSVFGLFATAPGLDMQWMFLGNVPATVSAVASWDGNTVLCGCTDGTIYSLNSATGVATKMTVNAPFPGGQPNRILWRRPAAPVCAVSYVEYTFGGTAQGALLQYDDVTKEWNAVLIVPDQPIFDVQVDETASPAALYVATDNRVFSSKDAGVTWQDDSMGLPERCHPSQLKIVRYGNGQSWLYLTTYGRSVWAANLAGH